MEKVLVTGATGFLGEYLVRLLVSEYQVYALGRNQEKGKALEELGAVFCPGDFTDEAQCRPYFQGIDYVIHAGALSTPWGAWPDFYQTNVAGTGIVCKLCRSSGVKRLVYVSSPSIYTEKRDRYRIREDQYDRKNNLNGYIKSKIMAEQQIRRYARQGLETVIIRPRGLIGIGDTSLVPRLLSANDRTGIPLFNRGRNQVDLTSVENAALACRLAMTAPEAAGEVFNITNGEPMEFKEILEEFMAAVGMKPRYRKLPFELIYGIAGIMERVYRMLPKLGEPPLTRYTVSTLGFAQTLDISGAAEKLGYHPVKTLKESIREYGEWWNHHNEEHGRVRTGLIEEVKIYHCGFCVNNLKHMFKKRSREIREFPAGAALIRHRKYGNIMYDTGYSERLFQKDPILWLYRTVNPVVLKQTDTLPARLAGDGIKPGDIRRVILSHGHPDHIGGLVYFRGIQLISTGPVIRSLRKPGLRNLVFKTLIPPKGTVRGVKILSETVSEHFLLAYFDAVYDVFGDGSIYGVVLAGHSDGQLGLWIPDLDLLLAADACWGSDLMAATKDMRWIAGRIQTDLLAYRQTVSALARLQHDYPEIKVVFSHQQGEETVYGRSSAGT